MNLPRVVLKSESGSSWLEFERPRKIAIAGSPEEIPEAFREIEKGVEEEGLTAVGFVSYEAAPAFDAALKVRRDRGFPLLWFGLFEKAKERPLDSTLPIPPIDWQPSVSDAEYKNRLESIRESIRRGDTYQVNFSYRLNAPFREDPRTIFLRMSGVQESRFPAYIETNEWAICSASPELFFELEGDRIVSRPMKGTAPRGLWHEQDAERAETLRNSEKDRAENLMIVDMVRNDLGRVARIGSVRTTELFTIEPYRTVWQMTSTVEARTAASYGEIFAALFPAASITGAPKARTMEIIAQLEDSARRIYCGAIGYFAPKRKARFSVAIRTLLVDKVRAEAEYGVGGGIVWDSTPEAERAECGTKSLILHTPSPRFSLLETVRWTPQEGFFLSDLHLERLLRSAARFGFPALENELREKMEEAADSFPARPQRVRLLVSEDGRVTIETKTLDEETIVPRVTLAASPVDSSNLFLYHKTTHRKIYEEARASRPGFDDVLLFNERGELTESTIANVAMERNGILYTPPVACGLLPGVYREWLLRKGELRERVILREELANRRRVFLMNSVRGIYEAVLGME